MKKCFPFVVVFLFHLCIKAQISEDKVKHFGAGVVIGGIGGYTANKIFNGNRHWTWAGAVGSSLAAGVAKEAWDRSRGGFGETSDVVYTVLGGAIAGLALDLLLNNNGRRKRGKSTGHYRRGKNCGCLVVDINTEKYNEVPILFFENGSRDVASNIQAQSIYNSTY